MALVLMPIAYSQGPRGLLKLVLPGRESGGAGEGGDTQERTEQSLNPFPACFTPIQGTQEGFDGLCCHQTPAAPMRSAAGRASLGSVMCTNCLLFQHLCSEKHFFC